MVKFDEDIIGVFSKIVESIHYSNGLKKCFVKATRSLMPTGRPLCAKRVFE